MGAKKVRADLLLVAGGLAPNRAKARAMIMAGMVRTATAKVMKPGQLLPASTELLVAKPLPFVGRGGLKLEAALDAFQVEVKDKVVADIGCSTGGFTDCLLQRGARKVYAVDVTINQLAAKLRSDSRVILLEKNARYLVPEDFAEIPWLITMDVSFISVLKILPALKSILKDEGALIVLLKPQFEAGRGQVEKKGVIRSPERQKDILIQVLNRAQALGFVAQALLASPILGQKGNREFFVFWRLGKEPLPETALTAMVSEVVYGEKGGASRGSH